MILSPDMLIVSEQGAQQDRVSVYEDHLLLSSIIVRLGGAIDFSFYDLDLSFFLYGDLDLLSSMDEVGK
jgi:hypothetical protein